jgi:hypothetical protein
MSTKRKPKIVLDLELKLIEAEKKLKSSADTVTYYQKQDNEKTAIIDSIHDILTDLGIREFRDENKYTKIPLAVRLFSWSLSLMSDKIKKDN